MKPTSMPDMHLSPRETLRKGISRLLASVAASARASKEALRTGKDTAEAVHATRLAMKRLRALLRLLRPTLGAAWIRPHNAALREAARRLAPARDAVVAVKTLGGLESSRVSRADAAAVARVREPFARAARAANGPGKGLESAMDAAAKSAERVARSAARATWRLHGWAVLEEGLRRGYRRARRRYREAAESGAAEAFHAWRTAAKALLYELTLLQPMSPKDLARYLERLDALQDTLGEDHDLSVLRDRLEDPSRGPEPDGGGTDAKAVKRTLALLDARQGRLRKRALKLGRGLFGEKPGAFLSRRHREWKAWRGKA